MRLVYIAYRNVSVFDSQVVALLNRLFETGSFKEITLICGENYKEDTNRGVRPKNLNDSIKIIPYSHYPQQFFIETLTVRSISKAIKLIPEIESCIVHVRNDVLAHYVYKSFIIAGLSTKNLIADVRGAGLEQLVEYANLNKLSLFFKKIHRKQVDSTLGKIKSISVVSESLKRYVQDKIGFDSDIQINSCLASDNFIFNQNDRRALRKKLNVKEKEILLVLSTGGDNAWQNTKYTIEMLTRKNCKILNLSRTNISHDKVINQFVAYNEMPKYLCAADAAIIWRNPGVTNKVASPVKFSEYICCGLPVISNDSIDLIAEFIKMHRCGVIYDDLDSIDHDVLDKLKTMDRYDISSLGRNNFGIEKISLQYVEFYEKVLKEK